MRVGIKASIKDRGSIEWEPAVKPDTDDGLRELIVETAKQTRHALGAWDGSRVLVQVKFLPEIEVI